MCKMLAVYQNISDCQSSIPACQTPPGSAWMAKKVMEGGLGNKTHSGDWLFGW